MASAMKNAGLKSTKESKAAAYLAMLEGVRYRYGPWAMFFNEEDGQFCRVQNNARPLPITPMFWHQMEEWQIEVHVDWTETLKETGPRWCDVSHPNEAYPLLTQIMEWDPRLDTPFIGLGRYRYWKTAKLVSDKAAAAMDAAMSCVYLQEEAEDLELDSGG